MNQDDRTVSPGARIARNAVYLLLSDVGIRLVSAVVAILVAKYLGPEQYGVLSLALALLGIAGYLTDLGLTPVMIREGTKPGANVCQILSGTFRLRVMFAIFASLIMVLLAWFYYPTTFVRSVILVVVLPGIWAGMLRGISAGYFQMVQEMQYVALLNSVAGLVGAGVFLAGVIYRWSLPALATGYGLSAFASGIVGIILLRRRVTFSLSSCPGLLAGLPAFALGGGLALLLPQLGPLLLPHAAGLKETGFFTAAYKIPGVLLAVPGVIATAFFPQLFIYGNTDQKRHLSFCAREIRLMGGVGLLLAMPTSLYAHWLVAVVFGGGWVSQSGQALAVLAWTVLLACLSWPLADALTTQGHQGRRTGVLAMAVLVGAGLYWGLGRVGGALGAAGAALAIESLLVAGFLAMNPFRKILIKQALIPVLGRALILVALAWTIKRVIGPSLVGFGLVWAVTGGGLLVIDREIRGYVVQIARILFASGRWWRTG